MKTARSIPVTPNEKIGVYVEDIPLMTMGMSTHEDKEKQVLTFKINVGDLIEVKHDNPWNFMTGKKNNGVRPSRSVAYELMSYGEATEVNGNPMFCVRSRGAISPIIAVDNMKRQINAWNVSWGETSG